MSNEYPTQFINPSLLRPVVVDAERDGFHVSAKSVAAGIIALGVTCQATAAGADTQHFTALEEPHAASFAAPEANVEAVDTAIPVSAPATATVSDSVLQAPEYVTTPITEAQAQQLAYRLLPADKQRVPLTPVVYAAPRDADSTHHVHAVSTQAVPEQTASAPATLQLRTAAVKQPDAAVTPLVDAARMDTDLFAQAAPGGIAAQNIRIDYETNFDAQETLPEVTALHNALAGIDIGQLDAPIPVDNVVSAAIALDARLRPQDLDRPASLPDSFIKYYLQHEAPGLLVPMTVAEKTSPEERYGTPQTTAAVYVMAEVYQQLLALHPSMPPSLLRPRDSSSPFHHHHDGGNVDISSATGFTISTYSDGPLFDSQFSPNYNREFTADFIRVLSLLRVNDAPLVRKVVTGDAALVAMFEGDDSIKVVYQEWHKDHAHIEINGDALEHIVTVAEGPDWTLDQDLRIGGEEVALTEAQRQDAHGELLQLYAGGLPIASLRSIVAHQSLVRTPYFSVPVEAGQTNLYEQSVDTYLTDAQEFVASLLAEYDAPLPDIASFDTATQELVQSLHAELLGSEAQEVSLVAAHTDDQTLTEEIIPVDAAVIEEDVVASDPVAENGAPHVAAVSEMQSSDAAEQRLALLVAHGYVPAQDSFATFADGQPVTLEIAEARSREVIATWDRALADQYFRKLDYTQWMALLWAEGSIPESDWVDMVTTIAGESFGGYTQIVGDLGSDQQHPAYGGAQISAVHGVDPLTLLNPWTNVAVAADLYASASQRNPQDPLQPWSAYVGDDPAHPRYASYMATRAQVAEAYQQFKQDMAAFSGAGI